MFAALNLCGCHFPGMYIRLYTHDKEAVMVSNGSPLDNEDISVIFGQRNTRHCHLFLLVTFVA